MITKAEAPEVLRVGLLNMQMRDRLEDHKISIKAVSYGMSPLGFGAFKPKP